jgi:hypothetical protein
MIIGIVTLYTSFTISKLTSLLQVILFLFGLLNIALAFNCFYMEVGIIPKNKDKTFPDRIKIRNLISKEPKLILIALDELNNQLDITDEKIISKVESKLLMEEFTKE